ncbi:MAG: hypothetical protein GY698_22905 [Actinomycetia bacterium]|nr:hypothetical protein [Actinomycetes bacterium]
MNVPDEDFASAPWEIRYGLAESVASCGFNRPTSGYLRITSEQIMPGLVEDEPYRYQLEVASANPVTWDVLDDPLTRYASRKFAEGLPAGLSLDPSTGEITGIPENPTSAASPAYATVRATTSVSSAVKQIVFGDPAVNDLVAHAAELPVAVPVDSFVSVSDLLVTETGYWAVEHSYSEFDGFMARSSLPALFRVSPDLGTINQVTLSGYSNTQLAGLQGDRVVQFEEHADSETYLRIIDSTGGIVSHVVGRSSNETFFDMAASVTTGHIILSYRYTDGSGRVAVYDPTTNAVVHELTLPLPHRLEASGDRVLLTPPPLDDGPILVLDLTDPAFVNSPVTLANPTAGYRWAAADDNSGVFWFQPVGAGDTVEVLDPASTTTAPHPLPAGLGSSLLEAASSNHVVFTATPESPNPQLVAALALVPVDLEGNLGLHPLGVLDIPVELFKGNDSTDGIPRVWAVPGQGTALFGTSYRRTVGSDADGFYPSLQALNMAAFDGGVLN